MPSIRSGARYNPSRSSQKVHRRDYVRSQSVTKGQGSVDEFQINKLCHSEADDTVLPSNRADTTTRGLSGHIRRHPEGLKQLIEAHGVPDPCRSLGKLHEFLPYCEKNPGPSEHLQVNEWMVSIDGKDEHDAFNSSMEENNPQPPKQVPKTDPIANSSNSNVKKQPQSQNKGKGKALATKTYSQGYRIPKIQQDAMENVFQMARKMMELQEKAEARLKYHE
ncbi:hypothetical protein O181_030095 [Austropuccinia psidii MF-1]|uniref:Uncharacterized protein n=1 Tax=Austropuccinia psidii MF-1 TaxID=1389203 RepID=A0A9Q3CVM1_9BASI|nr:hypothetical protein [Austropuccinia psidii MF-1]